MKKAAGRKKVVSADAIAEMADKERNVSRFFTNSGRMIDDRRARTINGNAERALEAGAMDERITEATADRATGKTRAL